MKVCLIRLDKIGDLVCTLPVDESPALEGADVHWVVSKGLGFIPRNSVPVRKFSEWPRLTSWQNFWAFYLFLRQEKFDLAVSFQAPWWVSKALLLARVPVRAGVRGQWHSFIYLNRTLRQRRSLASQHEADYNADLLNFALNDQSGRRPTPVLKMAAPGVATDFWLQHHLTKGQYAVVHPGMAGSALNWPQKNYVMLVRELAKNRQVVITGTTADESWLTEVRAGLAGCENIHWEIGTLSPEQLLNILAGAQFLAAPSTGVAHLAAALGRPVLAFFSPLRVQRPQRWSPRGPVVHVLMPDRPNMELITPEQALAAIGKLA